MNETIGKAEAALLDWLSHNRPDLACALDYCATYEEMRKVLNHHTGIYVAQDEDREVAFRRYLQKLEG